MEVIIVAARHDRSNQSTEMVRPNFTITPRHDNLLDRLAEDRYASRSEALRAAIEHLNKSVSEDGDTVTEQLLSRIEQLTSQVQSLEDRLDDISSMNPGNSQLGGASTGSANPAVQNSVKARDTDVSDAVRNTVYSALLDKGELPVQELAEVCDESVTDVHQAIQSLVDEGLVTSIDTDDQHRYDINTPD
ncbi:MULTISPECIES: helix-turn-helix domain-containing protein [Halolamina]|uniref:helix-turn-helix domain-containing protein n=1 Tax=Halolamina TaxID=1075397 RepID=UPI0009447DD1|nr:MULTISPECIES: helix-turn-helix domain-containing protein [Halolamina]NHX37282.1 ribbon-helix-helix protein, CopG family [Halolamina sp. R1-12]